MLNQLNQYSLTLFPGLRHLSSLSQLLSTMPILRRSQGTRIPDDRSVLPQRRSPPDEPEDVKHKGLPEMSRKNPMVGGSGGDRVQFNIPTVVFSAVVTFVSLYFTIVRISDAQFPAPSASGPMRPTTTEDDLASKYLPELHPGVTKHNLSLMYLTELEEISKEKVGLAELEKNSKPIVDSDGVDAPPPRNDTPHEEWMYEPRQLSNFWSLPDRRFIGEIYPRLGRFSRVLDVGARGYNRECKGLINSPTTQYYQVEPFPPDVVNNDGLLKCKVHEIPKFYPQYESFFDVALDFGVFGWGETRTQFNTTEEILDDVRAYMDGILFVLKPKGLWILKVDGDKWVPDENFVFEKIILPHFELGNFEGHASGVGVKNNRFRFYFFYRREKLSSTVGSVMLETSKNPILRENEQAGTSDWVLSKPAMNREIEGYMSKTSIQKGHSILLFFNTASPNVIIDIFRTGWYDGKGARRYAGPVTVAGVKQVVPLPDGLGIVACNWTNPYLVETDDTWTTGVYLARMTETGNGTQSYAIFVVRDDNRVIVPDVMFQLPVNTYQAYNYWGGKSLYGWGSGGPDNLPWGYSSGNKGAKKVSFDRPYARSNNPDAAFGNGAGEYLSNIQPIHNYPISSSASWNYNMVRWLERNGIDTSYITNIDVHLGLYRFVKPKLFLTQGHDEYWSWEMRDQVEGLRDQGVHLAFLGSNTAFMQVRFEGGGSNDTDAEPRIIVCYRFIRSEPIKNHLRTLKWKEVGRPETDMVGVGYIGDPFDADLVIANASHWVFNGTGLSNGNVLPGLLGYEVDGAARQSKMNIDILFETPLVNRVNETLRCHGTIYTAPSGAHVFAPGTMQWSWGLDDFGVMQNLRGSRLSRVVDTVTWNVFLAAGILPNGL